MLRKAVCFFYTGRDNRQSLADDLESKENHPQIGDKLIDKHNPKAGIYDQLISEYGDQFTAEEAQYAIDNIQVDWNQNALKSAESYSENMHMSKAGIFDQLTSEYADQFTAEEAQYAVDNVQADWNENALESARSYLEMFEMSNEEIFDQLTSAYGDQFTAEQAQYAIEHLNG